jgi:hypothetical protein
LRSATSPASSPSFAGAGFVSNLVQSASAWCAVAEHPGSAHCLP